MNGYTSSAQNEDSFETVAQVLQALDVVYASRSANSLRQEATDFLEGLKLGQDAPHHGFVLASNRSLPADARHYGLSLLDHSVRHRWEDFSSEQLMALRQWAVDLGQDVSEEDPTYILNKVAGLWVEIAKRSWALSWMDMDALLVQLWEGPLVRKSLVLKILETLSEDVFGHEDFAAGLRGTELNRACVEIFTPASILHEQFPNREMTVNVRYGNEGWLPRIGQLLDWCLQENGDVDSQRACAIRALGTMKSVLAWIIPRALVEVHSIKSMLNCFSAPSVTVKLVGLQFSGIPWTY